jgi:hypothetical protein
MCVGVKLEKGCGSKGDAREKRKSPVEAGLKFAQIF